MMASLDTRRPAAMEQLQTLGKQIEVATLPIVAGESPIQITQARPAGGETQGFDVLILDTAGRITLDEALMAEVAEVAADRLPSRPCWSPTA
jgi:signal recognition particle subunit SRP54